MTQNQKNIIPRILIIDDSSSNLEMISSILRKKNYQIATAKNGRSGIAKAKANNFDLILLDIILPDIIGYEVCRQLKNFATTRDIPIIFISVKEDVNSIVKGFEAGGVDYVLKPFNEQELCARIKIHLELKFSKEKIKAEKEKAEESDRLKSLFLSEMSHDIRSPVNAIIGFSKLLQEEHLTQENSEKFIKLIINSGKILTNLINDIIEISKIEAKQIKIVRTDCKLNQIMSDLYAIKENQRSEAEKNDVSFNVFPEVFDENFTIITDPYRLNQILTNLVDNALKFTKRGKVEFGYNLPTKNTDLKNKQILFYVKDTGIGIPLDKQDIIFNRYVQTDDFTTTKFGGTGLGLAISKNLVNLFGGKIWVKSTFDKGSTFYFTIPYIPAKIETSKPDFIKEVVYNWENKVILIADDIQSVCIFFKNVLQKTKAKTLFAKDGVETLNTCRDPEKKIDLVLMDLQMPNLSGLEATKQIRQFNKDIFIIAQTAIATQEEQKLALEAGCNDVIFKPINPKKLLSLLSQYLDK